MGKMEYKALEAHKENNVFKTLKEFREYKVKLAQKVHKEGLAPEVKRATLENKARKQYNEKGKIYNYIALGY